MRLSRWQAWSEYMLRSTVPASIPTPGPRRRGPRPSCSLSVHETNRFASCHVFAPLMVQVRALVKYHQIALSTGQPCQTENFDLIKVTDWKLCANICHMHLMLADVTYCCSRKGFSLPLAYLTRCRHWGHLDRRPVAQETMARFTLSVDLERDHSSYHRGRMLCDDVPICALIPSNLFNSFSGLLKGLIRLLGRHYLISNTVAGYAGEAHWLPLLRARAIENQAYVIAAAQAGRHNERRESYGHAVIIDPWGRVAASLGDPSATGIATAEIDHTVRSHALLVPAPTPQPRPAALTQHLSQ